MMQAAPALTGGRTGYRTVNTDCCFQHEGLSIICHKEKTLFAVEVPWYPNRNLSMTILSILFWSADALKW